MTRPDERFTARERAIVAGLAEGRQLSEVSKALSKIEYVVPDHIRKSAHRLYRKLGTATQAGAVYQAIRVGLLPCPCLHHRPTHPSTPRGTRS